MANRRRIRRRKDSTHSMRLYLLGIILGLSFIGLTARAYQLQILRGKGLKQLAENQYLRQVVVRGRRGVITDQAGHELAASTEVDSIYAHPDRIRHLEAAATGLAEALGENSEGVRRKLNSGKPFVWLRRRVNPNLARRVLSLDLPGVASFKESRRFYPNREFLGHVLGFVGVDGEGLEGLELAYDHSLRGRPMLQGALKDALGRSLLGVDMASPEELAGSSLVLTINRTIQNLAEETLQGVAEHHHPRSASAVVMDPHSGALLALAIWPPFNPNVFWKYKPGSWRNRVVTDIFEPGSTFKVILMAAALEEGLLTPQDRLFCEKGIYAIGRNIIHDHHPYGWLTVREVLKFSSNICAAKIAASLGPQRFHRYIRDFGFGKVTGAGLPGELAGTVRPPKRWREIGLATAAFGQGVAVTALQLATAVAAVANGGALMRPFLVKRMVHSDGTMEETHSRVVRRVIRPATARVLTGMMEAVIEEGGTGSTAALEGFRVAGKTGTAQKVDPVSGGYSEDKRVASFVGFVPAQRPRLVVVVVVDEPEGSSYGGVVAAPAFRRIARGALHELGIVPEPVMAKR